MKDKYYSDCFNAGPERVPDRNFCQWLDEFVLSIRAESSQAWARDGSDHHAVRSAAEAAAAGLGRIVAAKVLQTAPSLTPGDLIAYRLGLRMIVEQAFSRAFAESIKQGGSAREDADG